MPRHLFVPILAGATLHERILACLGALIAIAVLGLVGAFALGHVLQTPLLLAPLGASAVLLFAVPASPLAQPWPIVGGNVISAFVGVGAAHLVHQPALAAGIAVAGAIAAMSFTRCLHPPGGAAALTAVLGGPAVAASGFMFPFVPVGLGSALLVALGYVFHRLSRRAYPHRPVSAAPSKQETTDVALRPRAKASREDIQAALAALHETFDIGVEDLELLVAQVEKETSARLHGPRRPESTKPRDAAKTDVNGTA